MGGFANGTNDLYLVSALAEHALPHPTAGDPSAGQGDLDFRLYIDLLKKTGYEGALIMHGLSEEQIPVSKKFLEEILNV